MGSFLQLHFQFVPKKKVLERCKAKQIRCCVWLPVVHELLNMYFLSRTCKDHIHNQIWTTTTVSYHALHYECNATIIACSEFFVVVMKSATICLLIWRKQNKTKLKKNHTDIFELHCRVYQFKNCIVNMLDNGRGEPTTSYKWSSWVREIPCSISRHYENY